MHDHPPRQWLLLHWMVVVVAFTAILGRLIEAPAATLVIWRTGLAAVLIFLFLRRPVRADAPPWRLAALGTGVLLGLHWLTFFGSVKLANVSICSAGIATCALQIAVVEAIAERRRPRTSEVLLGLVVVPAVLLIVGVEPGFHLGLVMALVSALLAAIFSVMNKALVRRDVPALSLTAWEVAGACAICLLASPLLLDFPAQLWPTAALDWLWIGLLATVCTVYSFALQIFLLKRFSAFELGLAINLEPIYAIGLAAVIFAEHQALSLWFFFGAALIVAANLATPLVRRWRHAGKRT